MESTISKDFGPERRIMLIAPDPEVAGAQMVVSKIIFCCESVVIITYLIICNMFGKFI